MMHVILYFPTHINIPNCFHLLTHTENVDTIYSSYIVKYVS